MQFQGSIRKISAKTFFSEFARWPPASAYAPGALMQVALQNATFPSKIRLKYVVFGLKRGESLGQ
jgi:hypothetical protein